MLLHLVRFDCDRGALRDCRNQAESSNLDSVEHVARFDRRRQWIEMRLRATEPQRVRVADLDLDIEFANREELRTESARRSRTSA
jgi:uncharacterized SAM-dependent methyltransferase